MFQQQQQQVVEENMSNLTSASGEASVSSGNRTEIGTNSSYPQVQQQYLVPQTQQPIKRKRNLPGNPGLFSSFFFKFFIFIIFFSFFCFVLITCYLWVIFQTLMLRL